MNMGKTSGLAGSIDLHTDSNHYFSRKMYQFNQQGKQIGEMFSFSLGLNVIFNYMVINHDGDVTL